MRERERPIQQAPARVRERERETHTTDRQQTARLRQSERDWKGERKRKKVHAMPGCHNTL